MRRWRQRWLGAVVVGGSVSLMLLAYYVRAGSGLCAGASGLLQVPDNPDAARSLGAKGAPSGDASVVAVIRRELAVAAWLVFVDVMKRMPITLMTRPFGWDTLTVRVHELTRGGEWRAAALWIALVLVGLPAVIWLGRGK